MRGSARTAIGRTLLGGGCVLCSFWGLPGGTPLSASSSSCPAGAVEIAPGTSIQAAVDRVGDGGIFCLRNGIHREQAVRPRAKQRFVGEGNAILNGSRQLTGFVREGGYWVAGTEFRPVPKHGECAPQAPTCDQPEMLLIDDIPLARVPSKDALAIGTFYIDYPASRLYLADDPTNRKVELTVASFAFESTAVDVSITNITVEKYASPAQKGAIHAREGANWTIGNCEIRLNSGAGISVGSGTRVSDCDIHHNGQIGIEGNGRDIRIEDNRIWMNNIHGFDATWEAGGVKISESDRVELRRNHVHDNNGPGLWCDIDCHNVVYEDNLVENNRDIGIFHEISFRAVIRRNVVRYNGSPERGWFWGAGVLLAASQDVEVLDNTLVVAPGLCGIMLIDQGRRSGDGRNYETRGNTIRGNDMTFKSAACAGGASDTKPGDAGFAVIANGNNLFDGNTYRVPRASRPARFVWDQEVTDWDGFRRKGLEQSGRLELF